MGFGLKFYLAEIVAVSIDLACAVVNHAHGCWLMNGRWSPVRRAYYWAGDVQEAARHSLE